MKSPPSDREGHLAWLASLTPDEAAIIHSPIGRLMEFITIAITKRAIASPGIKPGDKLHLLEKLNGLVDGYLTPEMLATIEPMGDLEHKIFFEAKSLDHEGDKAAMASFHVLTSPRVFWHLSTLNPSYLRAIKMHEENRAKKMPVQQTEQPKAPQEILPRVTTDADGRLNGPLSARDYIEKFGSRHRIG